MEDVKAITITELVQRAQPLTATSSLYLPSSRPIFRKFSSSTSVNPTPTPTPPGITDSNPKPRVLTSLNHSAIIVGTLTLPGDNSSSSRSCNSCFQFSDGSSTICCDILEFDVCVIGKKIHVFSWNFIPLKRGCGFLEIIKWSFPDYGGGLREELCRGPIVDSFPLLSSSSNTLDDSSRARHRVYGVLESITPLSVVPCTVGGNRGSNSKRSSDMKGFLAQIMVCGCELCGSKDPILGFDGTVGKQDSHSFTEVEFVYFCGTLSSWHPVFTKLIGNRIMLSNLKKKLVFIGKEESCLMYVTAEKSILHLFRFRKKFCPIPNTYGKRTVGFGSYTGIIKGVYMQGMVVELDNEVWLVLTDPLLTPPHALRVGAVICVRNVHFVNPKFSWTKILILGACFKTSIIVESFSPLETRCHVIPQSPSMLGKFIVSLPFSARLWVLLLVTSLRKKFAGILSEKEILGSKHKEGLAQMYATSHLNPSVFQNQHGVFMGLCKHNSLGCGRELHCGFLKLVIPMSSFIHHVMTTWLRMLKSSEECKMFPGNRAFSFLSCEGRSYAQSVRRILPSKDLGVALLGNLKISLSTGRLQLVDVTGGIDVLVPDLPLTLTPNNIYEVVDYTIIMEGIPELMDHLGLLESEQFSCRRIFSCTQLAIELNISIYVYFLFRNATCRNAPFHHCSSWNDDFVRLQSVSYHLIMVSHKFPLLQKFQDNPVISSKSSMLVEAILLPWNLFLGGEDGVLHSSKLSRGKMKEPSENCRSGKNEEQVSHKRQRSVNILTSSGLKDYVGYSNYKLNPCSKFFTESEKIQGCFNFSSSRISCLATVRGVHNESTVSSAILHCTAPCGDTDIGSKPTARKILLELVSDCALKYQLLQIGGYYIIKHDGKDPFCIPEDSNGSFFKVLINSRTHLYSISFTSDEVLCTCKLPRRSSLDHLSSSPNWVLSEDQIEQFLWSSDGNSLDVSSDVCLYLPANLKGLLEVNLKELEEGLIKPGVTPAEISTNDISPSIETVITGSLLSSGFHSSNHLFPDGNFISLQGNIVNVHSLDCTNSCLSHEDIDVHRFRVFQGVTSNCCIHVSVDDHIVKVSGSISKYAFPVGFHPGVCATFHRVLDVGGQNQFMLTPVSFIVVNSIRALNEPCNDQFSNAYPTINSHDAAAPVITLSGLISELAQCSDSKHMRLHCRVVAVYIVVLERKARSKFHSTLPLFNIPVAGFVLDDGSSSCCCWANAERAATLLRLHEDHPQRAFESSDCRFKWVEMEDNASSTMISHLERILKYCNRVTVRNYGSVYDCSYQNLVFVTSDNALSSSDENILKFIIFNACFGTVWTVVASVMGPDAIKQLEKEYPIEMENTHTMKNIWAQEVSYMRPLSATRNMITELLKM
ncbi:CST complex subunit CTC1 isoform X1 [Quillaja saponaria]|uniref:CST complex subunit CTC1 n=1 Tax=Quillaja saponaria TaxID=32244 RepID=A0AAD7LH66_QUISA|nr:CST complex subunit CTC1 isoform X1 [Quillaja saponaria]